MKTIVMGVTSSIASYKAIELVEKLKKEFDIEIIVSKNTDNLIGKKEFENVLGRKVHTELFYKGWTYKGYLKREESEHISLADKADIFVICPATANTIGKIANGIADDLLTTSVMATNVPVLICPAMNYKMWENKIVQENVLKLKRNGFYFVEPGIGHLACGCSGVGRLAEIDTIIKSIKELIDKKNSLKGKRIIVTAGGTVEEIDPVRVITNKSSGKMGIYIAEEAAKMGALVTLIRGKTEIEPMGKINDIKINSVNELSNEIENNIKSADIMIHAAAVSDFSIIRKSNKKIKSNKCLILRLKKTIKIIDSIKKLNKKIKLVGFKAEYKVSEKELVDSANSLLKRADADFVVANDVSKGVFGSEENDVVIVGKKVEHVKGGKREIGKRILELVR
ncbi:MAG: bifunctional phosphopantothenoylcysteine decarboxylase/phosphopantothenate--cysteine ligase CoaBC [Nanoarchaeota archaeon]|nr:bifunctional phosphopantothenoylcysteine decarboxylase/phosphopantothenate--cysteine ligase CoaBC [Nanoarchaeota archaeon]MBU1004584.1 bifunctional phosphopantothenoylcysteine decarboxylase/phosphopantothenate--cysteine ligase CoaBC [Nanoarchaeota archaeon]MBU1946990.1 bifunctional phosphopantothenoylcysteine decarboxylase/phosphopantothenate--cysteine ligase CoaBC [Nanoarchaeota archaeon]